MQTQTKPGSALKAGAQNAEKKPYRSPKVVIYGDFNRLTLMKGANDADGTGNPPTRN